MTRGNRATAVGAGRRCISPFAGLTTTAVVRVAILVSLTAVGWVAVAVTIACEAVGSALSPRTTRRAVVICANIGAVTTVVGVGIQNGFAAVNYLAVTIVEPRRATYDAIARIARCGTVGFAALVSTAAAIERIPQGGGIADTRWVAATIHVICVGAG